MELDMCNGVCDGPGVLNDGVGSANGCCNSGAVDCAGDCDSALSGTGVDGTGNDCNGECGGTAEVLAAGWIVGSFGIWDDETSWEFSLNGVSVLDDTSAGSTACFLDDTTYELSLCDSAGDGWHGSRLTIGDENYAGPYSDMDVDECLVTSPIVNLEPCHPSPAESHKDNS
jgi:hypothetical protein